MAKKRRKKSKPVSKLGRAPTKYEKKKGKVLILLVVFIVFLACGFIISQSM
jgi:flagellar basal body-associated protein FliL